MKEKEEKIEETPAEQKVEEAPKEAPAEEAKVEEAPKEAPAEEVKAEEKPDPKALKASTKRPWWLTLTFWLVAVVDAVVLGVAVMPSLFTRSANSLEFVPALTITIICGVIAVANLVCCMVIPTIMKKRKCIPPFIISIAIAFTCFGGSSTIINDFPREIVAIPAENALTDQQVRQRLKKYEESLPTIGTNSPYANKTKMTETLESVLVHCTGAFWDGVLSKGFDYTSCGLVAIKDPEYINNWSSYVFTGSEDASANYGKVVSEISGGYNGDYTTMYLANGSDGLISYSHFVGKDDRGVSVNEYYLEYYDGYGVCTREEYKVTYSINAAYEGKKIQGESRVDGILTKIYSAPR